MLFQVKSCSIFDNDFFSETGENMNAIFREAIWPLLTLGQFFGILPVVGVKNRLSGDLHFKWTSIRTYYSLVVGTSLIAYTLLSIWKAFTTPFEYFSTIGRADLNWTVMKLCSILKLFSHFSYYDLLHLEHMRIYQLLCTGFQMEWIDAEMGYTRNKIAHFSKFEAEKATCVRNSNNNDSLCFYGDKYLMKNLRWRCILRNEMKW